jgi:hypothetical protein
MEKEKGRGLIEQRNYKDFLIYQTVGWESDLKARFGEWFYFHFKNKP